MQVIDSGYRHPSLAMTYHRSQPFEGVIGVAFDEGIDMGQGRSHAFGQRCVTRCVFQRVYPDELMCDSMESFHLIG